MWVEEHSTAVGVGLKDSSVEGAWQTPRTGADWVENSAGTGLGMGQEGGQRGEGRWRGVLSETVVLYSFHLALH